MLHNSLKGGSYLHCGVPQGVEVALIRVPDDAMALIIVISLVLVAIQIRFVTFVEPPAAKKTATEYNFSLHHLPQREFRDKNVR